ncbi:MAG: F-box protein [Proteobacteria bacterium]|nr:F-box protein [Pseudomonadota bacterium]
MAYTLRTLAACLLASVPLFASPGTEEASQAPHGIKRLASEEELTGIDTHKKMKVISQPAAQAEEQPVNVFPLTALSNELLFQVFSFLPKRDLISVACTGKHFKEPALTYALIQDCPTRVWSSALTFTQDLDNERQHHTFVTQVMPRVMHTMLEMYRTEDREVLQDFKRVLRTHKTFASGEALLGKTPLWQFLKTIKSVRRDDLDPAKFSRPEVLGDGDRVFLNMLLYIKANFGKSPWDLDFYDAPAHPRFLSPQARMEALAQIELDESVPHIGPAMEECIKTFHLPASYELLRVARAYEDAMDEENDDFDAKAGFGQKRAELYERALYAEENPHLYLFEMAAKAHQDAAYYPTDPSQVGPHYAQAATIWEKLLGTQKSPSANTFKALAWALTQAAIYAASQEQSTAMHTKSVGYWNQLIAKGTKLNLKETISAAKSYGALAETLGAGTPEKTLYTQTAAELWHYYVTTKKKPGPDALIEAANALYRGGLCAADPDQRALSIMRGAQCCDRLTDGRGIPDIYSLWVMTRVYRSAATHAPSESEARRYALKSVRRLEQYLSRRPEPSHEELRVQITTYYEAFLTLTDPVEKMQYLAKSLALCDAYFAKDEHPGERARTYASAIYAQGAVFTQDPALKALYQQKSDALIDARVPAHPM